MDLEPVFSFFWGLLQSQLLRGWPRHSPRQVPFVHTIRTPTTVPITLRCSGTSRPMGRVVLMRSSTRARRAKHRHEAPAQAHSEAVRQWSERVHGKFHTWTPTFLQPADHGRDAAQAARAIAASPRPCTSFAASRRARRTELRRFRKLKDQSSLQRVERVVPDLFRRAARASKNPPIEERDGGAREIF